MSPLPHELALLAWVESALPSISGVYLAPVLDESGRSARRPARPYATVQILADKALCRPHHETTDTPAATPDKYAHRMVSQRTGTASVSIYADDHAELARDLEMSIEDPDIVAETEANALAIRHTLGKQGSTGRNVTFEGFSVLDVAFGYVYTRETSVYVIESATVTGDI